MSDDFDRVGILLESGQLTFFKGPLPTGQTTNKDFRYCALSRLL